jgi:AraC family transcriptional regulator, transcriptional activator of the genes for pyochelin and ferripyochelin receptors
MNTEVMIQHPQYGFVRFNGKPKIPVRMAGREILRPVPQCLGHGRFLSLDCRPGMDICMSRCRFIREYRAKITLPEPRLTFVFCMSGSTQTRNVCCPSSLDMSAGQAHLYFFEEPVLERRAPGKKELQAVVVRLSREALEYLLDPDEERRTVPALTRAIQQGCFFWNRKMNFVMQSVLFQMFACPHQGMVRRIFLESKAMELVAYTLEQAFGDNVSDSFVPAVPEDEKERILKARDLLIQRLQFPPALIRLAGQVGMSHARLTRGFKKIFGCTVFEYLRKERLAYGRLLLAENKLSITQVAFEAGFCSSSHFASAFHKQFGVSPSAFRTGHQT